MAFPVELPLNISLSPTVEWSTVIVTRQEWRWDWLLSPTGLAVVTLVVTAMVTLKLVIKFLFKIPFKIMFKKNTAKPLQSECCGAKVMFNSQENVTIAFCEKCKRACQVK